MENYQLKLKASAKQDLQQLNGYLVTKFGKQVAVNSMRKLHKSLQQLTVFPELGRDAVELSNVFRDGNYRYLHLKRSTVFYKIYPDDEVIRVLRIYNNKTDVMSSILSQRLFLIDDENKE